MVKNIHILLVDDSEVILSRLKTILSGEESIEAIETAVTVKEAKERIEKQKPDVIILDVKLPDGNGIIFLKQIKFMYPEIIVVILTNWSDSYFKSAAEKYGADYFLDKSMEFEKLPWLLTELSN